MEFLLIVYVIILSYFVGSFPSAVIISKLFFGFDIREKGSGNMGSTNAFRVLGWKWGIIVQLMDITKGLIAVLVIANLFGIPYNFGSNYFENATIMKIIAGLSAVLGHIFSFYVSFKGGKGINTALGMLIGIVPVEVGIALGLFIIAVIFSGYISLGSIIGSFSVPIALIFRHSVFGVEIPGYLILTYFLSALAIILILAHLSNIKRLIKGTENKFHKLHLIKLKK